MNNIADYLLKQKHVLPDRVFIKTASECLTFKEADEKVTEISNRLNQFEKNSVIAMMFENSIEFVITYLGIVKSGKIAHIIPPLINEKNFFQQINSSNPEIILTTNKLVNNLTFSKNEINFIDFNDFLNNQSNSEEDQFSEIASLIYTSGTTSAPKGVPIKHSNISFTTKNIINVLEYNESDINTVPLPLSHSFGLGCLHVSLFNGTTLILHKNTMNILDILNSIEEDNSTTFAAVPATLTSLVNNFPDKFAQKCKKLRLIVTNSTKVPTSTTQKILELLPNTKFATYYGLTEASRSTFMIFNENKNKMESVGKPAPNVEIKISNDNHEKEGEIMIKGKNVVESYWDSEFKERFSGGWIKTGDIGTIDDDGFLYLKGRKDNTINVAGEKVNPEEIEEVVKRLDSIEETIAIGKEHQLFGQVVKLFVKKKKEKEIDAAQILKHCKNHLERFKVPTEVEFVTEFPKTDYGKVKRFMLR